MTANKTVARLQKNNLTYINTVATAWIGATPGDYLIVKEEEGKHGRYISIYKPTNTDDLALVDRQIQKAATTNGA